MIDRLSFLLLVYLLFALSVLGGEAILAGLRRLFFEED